MNNGGMSTEEQLILAGIEELEERGVQDFSLRQVAKKCGVSCAAPYKHFKDKQEFILGIIHYINNCWTAIQDDIISRHEGDIKTQLLEVSMGYVRFLVDNPHFRSVIIMLPKSTDEQQQDARHQLSANLKRIVHDYCTMLNLPKAMEQYKLYVVRSLLYGAAMFIDNGQLEDNSETIEMVRSAVAAELEC